MRKIFTFFVLLSFIGLSGFSQWSALNSGTFSVNLYSVYFTDANTGYAVGDAGTILKTNNAGENWTALTTGTYNGLMSIYFTDANTGYAVGSQGLIIKTSNAGSSWSAQTTGPYNLSSIFFTDANNGYAVGYYSVGKYSVILKTSNAGANWTTNYDAPDNYWLSSVYFTDDNTGYSVGGANNGSGTIIKTVNAGTNWTSQIVGSGLYSVCFTNATTGYAVGDNGTILKTTNAGMNWIAQTSGTINGFRSIYFINSNTGYAVGTNGTILKTTNAGTNWVAQTSGTTNLLESIRFKDVHIGYTVGYGGTILKTYCGTPYFTNNPQLVCYGESYVFNGHSYATAGTYHDTLTSVFGCDSIIITDLIVNQPISSSQTFVECAGFSIIVGIHTYNTTGIYTDILTSVINGCDSTVTTHLTINPLPVASSSSANILCNKNNAIVSVSGSGGTAPYLGTGTFTETMGTHSFTIIDANGCSANTSVDVIWVGPCDTKVRTSDCGNTFNNLNQAIYCDVVNGATDYELEFTATDFSFTRIKGNSNSGFRLNWITGIEFNKTYNVRARAFKNGVWGNFSTACQIITGDFPSTELRTDFCGTILTKLNQYVYCNPVAGALDYEWEFVNSESSYSFTKIRGIASPSMLLSWITGLEYGKTYDVRVKAKVGSQWGNFGAVCTITTPDFPTTKVRTVDCGITLASFNKYFYCDAVSNAVDYEWQFKDSLSGTIILKTRGSHSTSMNLNIATGIQNGKSYNVRVRAKIGNQWGSFGAVCQITAPNASVQKSIDENKDNLIIEQFNKNITNNELSLFPNPVGKGNSFTLTMQSDNKLNDCKINVYNIIGQVVYSKQLNVDSDNYSLNIEQNDKFTSGLFIIQCEFSGETRRLKMIVE